MVESAGWQLWQVVLGLGAPVATTTPAMKQPAVQVVPLQTWPAPQPAPAATAAWAQAPLPSQRSLVQGLASEAHAVAAGSGAVVQPPAPSQAALAWHSVGAHVYAVPPQAPPVQTSLRVQASPSSQAVPSARATGAGQAPVAGLQVPPLWHASGAAQATGLLPTQTPAWQASVWVQASPSLHAVPVARLE